MAGITLTQAAEMLSLGLDGMKKVLKGQKIRIGEEEYTMANLSDLQKFVEFWNGMVKSLGGSSRVPAVNVGLRGRDY